MRTCRRAQRGFGALLLRGVGIALGIVAQITGCHGKPGMSKASNLSAGGSGANEPDAGAVHAAGGNDAGSYPASSLSVALAGNGVPLTAVEQSVCAGKCIDVSVNVTGGQPPYTYVWSDPALSGAGPHHLCPTKATGYMAAVTDSPGQGEFVRQPLHATVNLHVTTTPCDAKPGDRCSAKSPSGSFDPIVKWRWTAGASNVTPMVANLTDDNGDGKIDLQDTPDVVVNALVGDYAKDEAALVILDGATGKEHFRIPGVSGDCAPALGDVDGDGLPDIIAVGRVDATTVNRLRMVGYRHDGSPLWSTPSPIFTNCNWPAAVAIADLDQDGSPEIIGTCGVYDASGALLWTANDVAALRLYASPTAADLDGDGKLEVVWGPVAYRYDGTVFYINQEVLGGRPDRLDAASRPDRRDPRSTCDRRQPETLGASAPHLQSRHLPRDERERRRDDPSARSASLAFEQQLPRAGSDQP